MSVAVTLSTGCFSGPSLVCGATAVYHTQDYILEILLVCCTEKGRGIGPGTFCFEPDGLPFPMMQFA